MGNYISCTLTSPAAGLLSLSPKVILPAGDIYNPGPASATAAELMLEHPGHFLVHSSAILINHRLFALSADEELELGAVYVMFPMGRVGSAATPSDIGRLLLAAGKHARQAREQIAPSDDPSRQALPADSKNGLILVEDDDVLLAGFRYKKCLCRSKRPVLETITEEAIF